jgi:hypothetical protein
VTPNEPQIPNLSIPALSLPDLGADLRRNAEISMKAITEASAAYHEERSAKGFVRRIMDRIQAFEQDLDADHEVGIRLVSFGQSLTFHVTQIGFIEPLMITFQGTTDEGAPVQLIQHLNQISFLLMRLNRLQPDQPKQPIGFREADI